MRRPFALAAIAALAIVATPAHSRYHEALASSDSTPGRPADLVALAASGAPPTFQCHVDPTCPEVTIAGDPPAVLAGSPAPFRGYGDPSIERDPATGTLWLAYSWLDLHVDSAGPPPVLNRGVQTHLARSDDGGATFTFVRSVNTASMLTHPVTGVPGWAIHEVPALLREPSSAWQMLWLTYFAPYGDFPPTASSNNSDFYYTRATAAAAASSLGDTSVPWIRGTGTSPAFGATYNLSTLPQLSDCVTFTEPALFAQGGTIYLATNCVVFVAGVRRPDLERLVLLRQESNGYTYAGTLLTYADAQQLGATRLEQTDLALSRSGAILLIASPIKDGSPETTFGCVAFQVTDLASATLSRDAGGQAILLATIAGDPNDSTLAFASSCTYDAGSATGVLMVLVHLTNGLVFSMHATGVHPDAAPASVGGVSESPDAFVTATRPEVPRSSASPAAGSDAPARAANATPITPSDAGSSSVESPPPAKLNATPARSGDIADATGATEELSEQPADHGRRDYAIAIGVALPLVIALAAAAAGTLYVRRSR